MRITILCATREHPIYPYLDKWKSQWSSKHQVDIVHSKNDVDSGDILFLISCHDIIREEIREKFRVTLVIHASNLPSGRGWSPHVWQIIEGQNQIAVTLFEAEDEVDSGAVWAQRSLLLEGHELYDEINAGLFDIELELMDFAVENFGKIVPRKQDQDRATYYRRRTPEDSHLDPHKTIAEQFDLLRVADPDRFAAFFDFRGHRYVLRIEKEKRSKRD